MAGLDIGPMLVQLGCDWWREGSAVYGLRSGSAEVEVKDRWLANG